MDFFTPHYSNREISENFSKAEIWKENQDFLEFMFFEQKSY